MLAGSRPRILGLCLTAAVTLLAGPTAAAEAACTVGKSTAYDNPADRGDDLPVSGSAWLAQSFTLSSPITLNKVALFLRNNGSLTQSIVVEIRSDSGDNPGAVLATRSTPFTNTSYGFDELDFSTDRLAMAAGTLYYIAAHSGGSYEWGANPSGGYGGGHGFQGTSGTTWSSRPTYDFLFQVFGETCTADAVPPGTSPLVLAAVSKLALSNDAFAAESSGPPATNARKRKRPRGTRVSYTLNEAASVRFTVKRKAKGRKVKRRGKTRCVKPTRKNRRKRKCTRLVTLRGSFTRTGVAGSNRFHFTGRLRGRKLRPGRYRLVATPSAGGKTGKPVSAGFRIVR